MSQGVLDEFWREAMQSGLKNSYECVVSLVPTLLTHGDDDQVVPVNNSERTRASSRTPRTSPTPVRRTG